MTEKNLSSLILFRHLKHVKGFWYFLSFFLSSSSPFSFLNVVIWGFCPPLLRESSQRSVNFAHLFKEPTLGSLISSIVFLNLYLMDILFDLYDFLSSEHAVSW